MNTGYPHLNSDAKLGLYLALTYLALAYLPKAIFCGILDEWWEELCLAARLIRNA